MSGFNLLECDHKVCIFTSHFLAMVISRERHLESLAFARFHSACRVIKLLEHLTVADDELKIIGLAAGEYFAVDLAFKIDHNAIPLLRWRIVCALGKGATLFAQNIERF